MANKNSKILIVGSSFGGLAALKTLIKLTQKDVPCHRFDITVIEPRAGFINVLAIPKTILDTEFAQSTFVELYDLGVIWDTIEIHHDSDSNTPEVYNRVLKEHTAATHHYGFGAEKLEFNDNVKLHFVQGYLTKLNEHSAEYSTGRYLKKQTPKEFQNGADEPKEFSSIDFDYCILASGRARNWPFDPIGSNKDEFVREMKASLQEIEKAKKISVIGGGALGVEIAGELKHYYSDTKSVELIHPHPTLPAEPLVSEEFKKKVLQSLIEECIDVRLESRVKEIDNKLVITKKDPSQNEPLQNDLTYWCNYHKNNIQYLSDSLDIKLANNDEIDVNEYLEAKKNDGTAYQHIFATGDITNLPVIKTAGGAYRQGLIAAENVFQAIVANDKGRYALFPYKEWPTGSMILMVGCKRSVYAAVDGKVLINDKQALELYKDYRNSNIYEFNGFRMNKW